MNTPSDRRRHPRQISLFSAKYTVKSGTYRDLVRNVSAGGIYIDTRQTIDDGQKISLRFPVFAFDRKPSVTGTVVRSQHRGFAVRFDSPVDAGNRREAQSPEIAMETGQSR